jgi:hypothetical protein
MSFLTGTNTELIYASTAAFTQVVYSSVATETCLNPGSATNGPQAHLPPDFWLPNLNAVGRGIKILARGIFQVVSATTPTITFNIRGAGTGSTPNVSTTPVLVGSAALTASSGTTTGFFRLEADIILKTIAGAGGNSTFTGVGEIISQGFSAVSATTVTASPLYGASATPGTVATVDTSITNYINVNAAFSATGATNEITLQQLLVFGLN